MAKAANVSIWKEVLLQDNSRTVVRRKGNTENNVSLDNVRFDLKTKKVQFFQAKKSIKLF